MKIVTGILVLISLILSMGYHAGAASKRQKKQLATLIHNEDEIKYKGACFTFRGGESFDFKGVKHDATVRHTYNFTNTGDKPLKIDMVTTDCGNARVMWDIEPILPGGKGQITVVFDARNMKGAFYKEIYIYSNANVTLDEKRYTLFYSGNIEFDSYKEHDYKVAGW